MEERSTDVQSAKYRNVIGNTKMRLYEMRKSDVCQIKTSIVNRKFRNSVYGCTLAVFETLSGKFIWWEIGFREEMLEILNAAYITGNPVTIDYINMEKEIKEIEKRIPNFPKVKGEDLLAIKVEIEKYK